MENNYFMSIQKLMACGHLSDSAYTDPEGNRVPVCGRCFTDQYANAESRKASKTILPAGALKGRSAACYIGEQPGGMRHAEVKSNPQLLGFRYQINKQVDTYYCGCLERID